MKMLLPKSLPLLSIISKRKPLLGLMLNHHSCSQLHGNHGPSAALFSRNIKCIGFRCKFFYRVNRLATLAADKSHSPSKTSSVAMSKKERRLLPENVLKHKLCVCSEKGNLVEALRLYDEALNNGVPLCNEHYSMLLYLCSSAASGSLVESQINGDDTIVKNLGMKRGFEIVQQMEIDKIEPNEATFTNTARLAAAREDPEMAFDVVKKMKHSGITPRLRSYGPALFGFCNKGEAIRAYDVDSHMVECGVVAEEPELSALLKVSALSKKHDKVYEILHRIRSSVRQVSDPTAEVVKDWFDSEDAANVGKEKWDPARIKNGVMKGGGGWHGEGWLGTGKWSVVRGHMDMEGVCKTCGEKLVCIDIDPKETENFASSLTRLASQREAKAGFLHFQEWLQKHGPFDAVIDGANIGLIKQKDFNFFQLNSTVNHLRKLSPSKRLPLIVLHQSRVRSGPADPRNKRLLLQWKESGALYETPVGSNDDWYWLYAAVSCNCLLVTNDEMRDHLFQLLGTSFFPRWKEKHQVRLSVSRSGINFHMPPSYSIVIQESETGSWHVPTVIGDDMETPREWLCITRTQRQS